MTRDWRAPPIDRALAELEPYVRATWNVHGIVVSGSIVRGDATAGPNSDLDVVVVHREGFRLRDQRRFHGVPAELFVNPPSSLRRYFVSEHREARPCTANMLATGVILGDADDVVRALIEEARGWLAKPLDVDATELTRQRYAAVDVLDDARDIIDRSPAAAALLLADAVRLVVAHAFLKAGRCQPRRKDVAIALAEVDPHAATLLERWARSQADAREALALVDALAQHVLGVTTFFEWRSEPDRVDPERTPSE